MKAFNFKYSYRVYEFFRSFFYYNQNTREKPFYNHNIIFDEFAKFLNLKVTSSYFTKIDNLKKRILEPVKEDLQQTNINFRYEIQKNMKKKYPHKNLYKSKL